MESDYVTCNHLLPSLSVATLLSWDNRRSQRKAKGEFMFIYIYFFFKWGRYIEWSYLHILFLFQHVIYSSSHCFGLVSHDPSEMISFFHQRLKKSVLLNFSIYSLLNFILFVGFINEQCSKEQYLFKTEMSLLLFFINASIPRWK